MELPDDEADKSICSQCGEEFWPELERGFVLVEEVVLCFECALARGGIYEEREDRWVKPPDLTGLRVIPDEAPRFSP
jgi:hypothetical protein